jgi:hypothetical protein
MKSSVLSFKDRGPWGDAAWPGQLLRIHLSGTLPRTPSTTVRRSYEGLGNLNRGRKGTRDSCGRLDLAEGFDICSQSILERVGEPASLVVSHPPHFLMRRYALTIQAQRIARRIFRSAGRSRSSSSACTSPC